MRFEPMQRLDTFMSEALSRYYGSKDPFGVDGDFTTAPEISQLFGEIIGIWAAQKWMEMGSPLQFNLIEIGPGRGTLMADLLRGTRHIKGFHEASTIRLVETSPALKAKQAATLASYKIVWHDHLNEITTDLPVIIIANEFFDALPVRQFQCNGTGWAEHYIDNGSSIWQKTDTSPFKPCLPSPSKGDIYEYSPAQNDYARLISTYKGAALIIDYGYVKSAYGDTLQALYRHKPCKIADHIGDADITTHVDFEWLSGFYKNTMIKTQAEFLQTNGIAIRYHMLNDPDLLSGYERLVHPEQMGELFKTLEILL